MKWYNVVLLVCVTYFALNIVDRLTSSPIDPLVKESVIRLKEVVNLIEKEDVRYKNYTKRYEDLYETLEKNLEVNKVYQDIYFDILSNKGNRFLVVRNTGN